MISHPCLNIPEMLAEIFSHCIENNEPASLSSAPLVLGYVCHLWRNVTYTTPGLWRTLSVTINRGKPRPSIAGARQWMGRSGVLPLSLSLYQTEECETSNIVAGQFLKLFTQYHTRWLNIHFELPTWDSLQSVQVDGLSRPSSLRSFELLCSQPQSQTVCPELTSMLFLVGMAPQLSGLKVLFDAGSFVEARFIPTTLTHLRLQDVADVSLCLNIIARCSRLVSCTLELDHAWQSHVDAGWDMVVLSRTLRYLEIHTRPFQFRPLFSHLTLPALQELAIFVDYHDFDQEVLMNFLTRSCCCLLSLTLYDTGISGGNLIKLCQHTSVKGLTRLSLMQNYREDWEQSPTVTQTVVEALTPSEEEESALLYALEALYFEGWLLSCTSSALVRMVESRWRVCKGKVAQLRSLALKTRPSDLDEAYEKLEQLEKEGFELQLNESEWILQEDTLAWRY